jgi:hypothetical protein
MVTINRVTQQDRDRKTIAAIQKYLMQMTAITIAGVTRTPTELLQVFQSDMQIADAATQAKASFLANAAAARNQRTQMRQFRVGFRAFLENTFTDPSIIAEFGISPRKAAVKTVDTKATAIAKSLATRKARHTLGKNQKKDIHGTVPAPAPTGGGGASPPPEPAPAPAPAPKPAS